MSPLNIRVSKPKNTILYIILISVYPTGHHEEPEMHSSPHVVDLAPRGLPVIVGLVGVGATFQKQPSHLQGAHGSRGLPQMQNLQNCINYAYLGA